MNIIGETTDLLIHAGGALVANLFGQTNTLDSRGDLQIGVLASKLQRPTMWSRVLGLFLTISTRLKFAARAVYRQIALGPKIKILGGAGVFIGLLSLWHRHKLRYYLSRYLEVTCRKPSLDPHAVRNCFSNLSLTDPRIPAHHTHGVAAADRSSSARTIDRLAASLGLEAYHISKSAADVRNGRLGSRNLYWVKDLGVEVAPIALPSSPLVAMVDVDYYVDMHEHLCDNPHPTVVYAFQPEMVARQSKDYSYTFNANDEVEYSVTGGGMYKHRVWNYSGDHLSVFKTWFGIPYKFQAYLVDRRSTSPDHELIALVPTGGWFGFSAFVAYCFLSSNVLKRLTVCHGKFLRLKSSGPKGHLISTGVVGGFCCANVPLDVDDAICSMSRTSKYDLTLPQVLSFVDGDRLAGAPLLEYHLSNTVAKVDQVYPVGSGVRRYQFDPKRYEPAAKPSMVAFMSPIVHGAFCPDQTVANEEQCVEGRVDAVRPKELPIDDFLAKVMLEFVTFLVPKPFQMDPESYDTVLERQDRPGQRITLAQAEMSLPERIIKMFMKRESYDNVKDPRAISTINGSDKCEYSRYMYAFERVLKSCDWYAFGHTPKEVGRRVVLMLSKASSATNTDFSRFDGHGSNVMRELERMVLMRSFRHKYHSEISELHKAQYGLIAYGRFGTQYFTGYSRASGSPETSLFNSLVNAFIAYFALRMSRVCGVYNAPDEAWSKLGIYGGDDGLTADVDEKIYVNAAAKLGQELTIQTVPRGQLGVKFLARVYSPYVWFGDENTCCDVPRQLAKLHVTVVLDRKITPTMKLLEKVRSFSLTDYHTPIIGDFCQAVVAVHGGDIKLNSACESIASWLSRVPLDAQHVNKRESWMFDYISTVLPTFEMKKFKSWLEGCHTLESFLNAPCCLEPVLAKPKAPVVLDGELLPLGACFSSSSSSSSSPIEYKGCAFVTRLDKNRGKPVQVPVGLSVKEQRKAAFEKMKLAKIADGTWTEAPPVKKGGGGGARA